MDTPKMLTVTVDGTTSSYPYGTPYEVIAREHQKDYKNDILLVKRDGKLRELCRTVRRDCTLTMLTAADKPGYQTYERSLILLFLKAFYDVVGEENIRRVSVDHTVSHALYIRTECEPAVDEALLARVQARMEEMTAAALPIRKSSVDTDDAMEFFRAHGMPDKAGTLSYRIGSHVNVYELDGFVDYYYGDMLPNTKYLKAFALHPWTEEGLYLILPTQADPSVPGPFTPSEKVSRVMYETSLHAERLGLANVGELNGIVSAGKTTELILAQEALMEKQVGDIAHEIASRPGVRLDRKSVV